LSVFIDSGAFVAALFRSDRHHERFRAVFLEPPRRSFTSMLVLSETYSWFLHKLDEESAREFLEFVDAITGLVVLDVPSAIRRDAKRVLDRFRGSKLTYVVAVSLVLIEKNRIKQVWGTDQDLTFTGASLVP
jgi:predicted nucleic acid-binding protein